MADSLTQQLAAQAQADVSTPHATRYMIQLTKHFQHKCLTSQEGDSGSIAFAELGVCRLRAQPGVLTLSLAAADPAQRDQLADVVGRHLRRFAFREDIEIAWHID
jgi:hypothetical protein